jgi:hypothetical protein
MRETRVRDPPPGDALHTCEKSNPLRIKVKPMSNNVIPLDRGGPAGAFAGRHSSLTANAKLGVSEGFAVVSIRGKVWRIRHRGESEIVKSADGMPMQRLDVVVVGASPFVSKQWYDGTYTEGSDSSPDCYSVDGLTPDPAVPHRQSSVCATCPRNRFGSRITDDGKRAKECRDSRRIAVVPVGDIDNEVYGGPMMLRLPATSLSSLLRYADLLEKKGAALEQVATGLYFDASVAYPRVEFSALRWLTEEEALQTVGPDGNSGVCANPKLERMLAMPASVSGPDTSPTEEEVPVPDPLKEGRPANVYAPRQTAAPIQTAPRAVPRQVDKVDAETGEVTTVVRPAPDDMLAEIDELLTRPA